MFHNGLKALFSQYKMPKTKVSSSSVTPVTTKVKKVSKTSKTKKVKEVIPKVEIVTEEVVPVEEPVSTPLPEEVVEPEEIVETVPVENDTQPTLSKEMEENAELVPDKKNTRRTVNKETVRQSWEELFVVYEAELKECKKKPNQKQNLLKSLNQLKTDCYRLLRIRNRSGDGKGRSSNSGFNKPVKVTPDLARFINVKPDDEVTRVLITQKLCSYVKENDLQNPSDRREILPDSELKKLFDVHDDNKDQKLTYYSMQRRIQPHIIKI